MPTIPTGKMELELRRLYVRWLSRLGDNTDMNAAVDRFEKQSIDLIEKMGGRTAMLGALADFPAPKRLDLSPHIGTIYSDMKQAAIQAGIQAGLNASDVARHMLRAGMDKSYNRLNRLARTETVSAYWKNAWDSIADLPELVMVWGSEDGPRTCAWCRERDGMVMESSQLRDHPNGRCTPIPTLRSMVEYKGSVDAGGRIYQDPAWNKSTQLQGPTQAPYTFSNEELTAGHYLKVGDEYAFGNNNAWTDIEQKAVSSYQAPDIAYYVNGSLRGYDVDDYWFKSMVSEGQDQFMASLDSAIAKGSLTETQVLYRGIKVNDDLLTQYTQGAIIQDQGYMSTSVMGKLAERFAGRNDDGWIMELVAPQGQLAAPGAPSLGEVILPRGTRLRVARVDHNTKRIHAEVLQ